MQLNICLIYFYLYFWYLNTCNIKNFRTFTQVSLTPKQYFNFICLLLFHSVMKWRNTTLQCQINYVTVVKNNLCFWAELSDTYGYIFFFCKKTWPYFCVITSWASVKAFQKGLLQFTFSASRCHQHAVRCSVFTAGKEKRAHIFLGLASVVVWVQALGF